MEEKRNGNENGNWRQTIRKLNHEYLQLVRSIGMNQEEQGYVQTLLGLDDATLNLLTGITQDEVDMIVGVKVPLFRLKLTDLQGAVQQSKKGNGEQAVSVLTAALVADKEGEA